MGRLRDQIIIQKGLYGPAIDFTRTNTVTRNNVEAKAVPGDSDMPAGSESATSFPAGQKILKNYGAESNCGLTLKKLIHARSLLGKSQIPMKAPGQEVVCVIGQSQLDDMLNIPEIQSADYNTIRALVAGEVDTYLGFKFVIVDESLLPATTASGHTTMTCFAYLKSNVVLAEPQPIKTTINQRPDKCNNWQVYSKLKAGSTRYEDKGVVQIECYY